MPKKYIKKPKRASAKVEKRAKGKKSVAERRKIALAEAKRLARKLARKRSLAAKKGAATRKRNRELAAAVAKKRSRAAKKGAATRKRRAAALKAAAILAGRRIDLEPPSPEETEAEEQRLALERFERQRIEKLRLQAEEAERQRKIKLYQQRAKNARERWDRRRARLILRQSPLYNRLRLSARGKDLHNFRVRDGMLIATNSNGVDFRPYRVTNPDTGKSTYYWTKADTLDSYLTPQEFMDQYEIRPSTQVAFVEVGDL